jgi:hypothetical protein
MGDPSRKDAAPDASEERRWIPESRKPRTLDPEELERPRPRDHSRFDDERGED